MFGKIGKNRFYDIYVTLSYDIKMDEGFYDMQIRATSDDIEMSNGMKGFMICRYVIFGMTLRRIMKRRVLRIL